MKAAKLFTLAFLALGVASCSDDDNAPEGEYFPSAESESFYIEPEDWGRSEVYPGGWEVSIDYPYEDMLDYIHDNGAVLVYLDRFDEDFYDALPFTDNEIGASYEYFTSTTGVSIAIKPMGENNVPDPGAAYLCKIVYIYADALQAQGMAKQDLSTMSLKEVESRFNVQAVTK